MDKRAVERCMLLGQAAEVLTIAEDFPNALKNPITRCKTLISRAAMLEADEETKEDTKIKQITMKEADNLLNSGPEKYKPIGLFYYKEDGKYVGIDNSTGDAWTEEFDSLEECKNWLRWDNRRGGLGDEQ